ncbi:MAG TPA: SDR family oxidoreductase [Myxococcota bacterium]|jgi:NAD(P)-dependent dehydrogenase (short-subunit alcohol dehydrogenase family)|nr:SDR family oxidoreductase [Myxococcota bacterium]
MSETVLVIGATSGIARALCRVLAARGCRLVLAGRRREELEVFGRDCVLRGAPEVAVEPFEALDFDSHEAFVARCFERFPGGLDGVVACHGTLPDQAATERDAALARRTIDANLSSMVTVLHAVALRLEARGDGFIAALSSVAGDRGRASNATYGAAKAGLTAFLSGLRNRLAGKGVRVLTVIPGFVATAMTEGVLDPDSPLVATPERVAHDIDRALRRRRDVLYTPWFWRYVMLAIRLLPERVFKRLRI